MRILIKFIIKSMLEKKVKTLLIILAVTLSATLFFASTSLSDNLVEVYKKRMVQTVGNAEIIVTPNEESPSPYVNGNLAKRLSGDTEYIIKGISALGDYKVESGRFDTIQLLGMNLKDLRQLNDLIIIQQENLEPFANSKVIISKYTADTYKLKLGDTMQFKINNIMRRLRVSAIVAPVGLFLNEANVKYAIVPFETMSKYCDSKGNPNILYIKGNGVKDIEQLTEDFKNIYSKYEVAPPFTEEKLKGDVSSIATPLLLLTIMIGFMSIFIIYSSFKVIVLQKLPAIGTFRSIGASKKIIVRVMILESLFYGMIGGLLACILGVIILYILTAVATPDELRGVTDIKLNISGMRLLITFILANFICLISSILPIINVSRLPVKDIVLNIVALKPKNTGKSSLFGLILVCIGAVLPGISPSSLALASTVITIICIFVGIINVLPLLVKVSAFIFEKISELLFGNIAVIALKNIKGDKSILNSISLITIGISVLLMVNTASSNLSKELIDVMGRVMIYDVGISFPSMDRTHISTMARNENIESVYPYYQLTFVEIDELDEKISLVDGVSRIDYSEYMNIDFIGDQEQLFQELQTGRNIVITKIFQKRYELNIGDTLTLDLPKGKKAYTIIGFADTMMNVGSFALIGENYLKMDTGQIYYSGAYINVKDGVDADVLKEEVRKTFKDYSTNIHSVNETKSVMKSGTKQLTSMLTGFSVLALAIGIVGVVNNLLISFIERKRSIAVLKSVGMSRKQVVQMIIIEALCTGLIGTIAGVIGGSMLVGLMPLMMEVMKVIMPVRHLTETFYIYLLGGVSITIIASITPLIKASKLNIIEAIKYE
jgi:putative ABC transport system permease protein